MSESNGRKGDFCFLANMKQYLSTFGVEIEEYWLGGITGVMGFYFTTLKSGIPSVIHGRSKSFEGMYKDLMDYLKKPLIKEYFTNKADALERVHVLLEKKIIPMMWMDEFYLPKAYNYQKNHLWVMSVIQKEQESELLIFNNEELIVRKERMNDLISRDGVIEIQYASYPEIEWKKTEQEMAGEGLMRVVENLNKKSTLPQQYFGIAGMKEYKKVFAACQDYGEIYNYFYEMNRGGGLYKTRRNMRLFLQYIAEKWNCQEAEDAGTLYASLEEQWTKITNLTFKLSVCKDQALQKRIEKRLNDAILCETQGVEKINKLVNMLL